MQYKGWVEPRTDHLIVGWAVDENGEPCEITVTIADFSITTLSDHKRADLERQNISKGLGGFVVNLRHRLRPGLNRIEVTYPDGTPVKGSPLEQEYTMAADGVITARLVAPPPAPAPAPAPAAAPAPPPAPAPAPAPVPAPAPATVATPPVESAAAQPHQPTVSAPPTTEPSVAEASAAPSSGQVRDTLSEARKDEIIREALAKKAAESPMTLSELDEISLTDISDGVADGSIPVQTPDVPPMPPAPEPVERAARPAKVPQRRGFFSRFFG